MVSKYEHNVALFSSASNSLDEDALRLHQGILIDEIKQISTTKKALWSLEDKKYTFLASPFVTKEWMKKIVIERLIQFGCAENADKIQPIPLKVIASQYSSGELSPSIN